MARPGRSAFGGLWIARGSVFVGGLLQKMHSVASVLQSCFVVRARFVWVRRAQSRANSNADGAPGEQCSDACAGRDDKWHRGSDEWAREVNGGGRGASFCRGGQRFFSQP